MLWVCVLSSLLWGCWFTKSYGYCTPPINETYWLVLRILMWKTSLTWWFTKKHLAWISIMKWLEISGYYNNFSNHGETVKLWSNYKKSQYNYFFLILSFDILFLKNYIWLFFFYWFIMASRTQPDIKLVLYFTKKKKKLLLVKN